MREFDTGATRDAEDAKLDPEGFLSPRCVEAYCQYMHHHRKQADGKMRTSDNWQKGIPLPVYMKSAWRHFFDLWCIHRGILRYDKKDDHRITAVEACCALLFNIFGYLHETMHNPEDEMGKYIPGPTTGKVRHLLHNGFVVIDEADAQKALKDGLGVVCVVDNGPFEAAGWMSSERELDGWLDPADWRPKIWMTAPLDKVRAMVAP